MRDGVGGAILRSVILRAVTSAIFVLAASATSARADNGRLLTDDTFAVHEGGNLVLDAGLLIGFPAALPTGMSTGIGAGITRQCGCLFSYGARASWSTASATSSEKVGDPPAWTVSHSDLRLRAIGAIRHAAGRGTLALRLGVGATIVHEVREPVQAMRAGRTDQITRAFATLPAADLEAVISVHVIGPWLMVVSGGPSVDLFAGNLHGGFTAQLGVAWQP